MNLFFNFSVLKMLQSRLSSLAKDLLVKILLKVKEERIYKVKIRNGYKKNTYYMKTETKEDVINMIKTDKEIRGLIIDVLKDDADRTDYGFYMNEVTGEVRRLNYRCIPNLSPWQCIQMRKDYDVLLETHFDSLFDDYYTDIEKYDNIPIEEIKIIPKI